MRFQADDGLLKERGNVLAQLTARVGLEDLQQVGADADRDERPGARY